MEVRGGAARSHARRPVPVGAATDVASTALVAGPGGHGPVVSRGRRMPLGLFVSVAGPGGHGPVALRLRGAIRGCPLVFERRRAGRARFRRIAWTRRDARIPPVLFVSR